MLLKGELYAITCIAGGLVYTQSISLNLMTEIAMVIAMLTTLLLRLAAMKWQLTLHIFKYPD